MVGVGCPAQRSSSSSVIASTIHTLFVLVDSSVAVTAWAAAMELVYSVSKCKFAGSCASQGSSGIEVASSTVLRTPYMVHTVTCGLLASAAPSEVLPANTSS